MKRRNFLATCASFLLAPLLPVPTIKPIAKTAKPFDFSQIYCSKEALDDIRNWRVDHISDTTKKEIFNSGKLERIYGCSFVT